MFGGAPIIGLIGMEAAKQSHGWAALTIAAILFIGGCAIFWRDRHDIAKDWLELWRRRFRR